MDREVAERLSHLMLRIGANLDQSVAYVLHTCSKDEFESYRRVAGQIMGAVYLDVAEKLYTEHPDLRPKQIGGPYEVPPSVFEPEFYPTDGK